MTELTRKNVEGFLYHAFKDEKIGGLKALQIYLEKYYECSSLEDLKDCVDNGLQIVKKGNIYYFHDYKDNRS